MLKNKLKEYPFNLRSAKDMIIINWLKDLENW